MRGVLMLGAAAVVAALAALPVGSAAADSTATPGRLTTTDEAGRSVIIPIPSGVTPTAVSGKLLMPQAVNGSRVTFLVNGRTAASVPATLNQRLRVPVSPSDVLSDDTLALSIRYDAPDGEASCAPVAATFKHLKLRYVGAETVPRSIGSFFPSAAPRINVLVAPDADNEVVAAALTAVAALSGRYPGGTDIRLGRTTTPPVAVGASQRAVVLAPGDQEKARLSLSVRYGVPTLTLRGSDSALRNAAAGLGGDMLRLAGTGTAEGLAEENTERAGATRRTLADLGADGVVITTKDTGSVALDVSQDTFGGTVSDLLVHLQGRHSAVPEGSKARLDVHINGFLVSSTVLDEDPEFSTDFTLPITQMQSVNHVELTIATSEDTTDPCSSAKRLPVEVDLDGKASTLSATLGPGGVLAGFQLYPQVLRGTLPVAIRASTEHRFREVAQAAKIVSSLQRSAAYPLNISVVDAEEFLASGESGLLVGASDADTKSLGAPLRLTGMRQVSGADQTFSVDTDQAFGALQSVTVGDRHLLLLGSWAPGPGGTAPWTAYKVASRAAKDGWSSLSQNVLISDGHGNTMTMSSTGSQPDAAAEAVAPPAAQPAKPATSSAQTPYTRWFVVGFGVLVLLIVLELAARARRRRRTG